MTYAYQPSCQIPPSVLDAIYTEAFGDWPGVFVEIGANDGLLCSNTWGLLKAGWMGIYAEPVAGLAEACRRNTQGFIAKVEQCAIGREDKDVVELGMGDWGATGDPNWMSKPEKFTVRQETLDTFLQRIGVHPLRIGVRPRFELLVIDVEGMEADVLAGFDCDRWRPQVVIIERPPFRNCFRDLGYRTVYADNINTIYVWPR